jgi:hypothetical protein
LLLALFEQATPVLQSSIAREMPIGIGICT